MKPGKTKCAIFSSLISGDGGIKSPSILSKIDRYCTLNWLSLIRLESKLFHLNKHAICNFCSCKMKASKISRLCKWDSNPWPLWYWCSALTKDKWWNMMEWWKDKRWIWKLYTGIRTNCCYLTLFFKAQKAILDQELDLITHQNTGEDTTELKKKVEELKQEVATAVLEIHSICLVHHF